MVVHAAFGLMLEGVGGLVPVQWGSAVYLLGHFWAFQIDFTMMARFHGMVPIQWLIAVYLLGLKDWC